MRPWWLGIVALGACLPEGPKDEPVDDTGDSDEPPLTDTDTDGDTDVEAPCPLPEVEPNDTPEAAQALPTEVRACGSFQSEADPDRWRFVTTELAWLAVDVAAHAIGSHADVVLLLESDDADLAMAIGGWMDQPDVRLRVPVRAGTFDAVVRQAVGAGVQRGSGPDWFYELRASTTKPPVEHEVAEDPTVAEGEVQAWVDGPTGPTGLTVLGGFGVAGDTDGYAVTVPEGRHRVRLEVVAHAVGSPSDVALRVTDADGALVQLATVGSLGWEPDAATELHTTEAVAWRVEVIEEHGRGGAGWWYALRAVVEAE